MITVHGTDEQRAGMFSAVAKAWAEIGRVTKDNEATARGGRKYHYADLTAVLDAIRPVLPGYGMWYTQNPGKVRIEEGLVILSVDALITHEGGAYISYESDMIITTNTEQGSGIGISYGRRYQATGNWSIGMEDNDGQVPDYQTSRSSASAPSSEPTGASRGGHLAQAALELGAVPVGKALITIEALNDAIKGTEFPGKGMLGMYLKQMNSYQAAPDDLVMSWAAQNPGVNAVELLSAAAQYAINVLPDGGMKQVAQKWLKENQ